MVRYDAQEQGATMSAQSALRSEEWDFTSYHFGLEGRKLEVAHSYEFARELPNVIEAFKRDKGTWNFEDDPWVIGLFKQGDGDPDPIDCFPYMGYSYFDLGWLEPGEGIKLDHVTIQAFEGFPEKPFLSVSKKEIAMNVGIILDERPLSPVIQERPGVWVDKRRCLASQEELFHFRINWDYSNDAILAEFKEWLSEPGRRPRKEINKKGKGGDRKLLADLKALGAFRLMRHFDGSISDAKRFSAAKSHSKSPLYALNEDWKIAKRKVESLLEDWGSRRLMGPNP